MKNNTTPGPDGIATEMIKAFDDFGIEKVTELANQIFESGKIPEELSSTIFIMIPKIPAAFECELQRELAS